MRKTMLITIIFFIFISSFAFATEEDDSIITARGKVLEVISEGIKGESEDNPGFSTQVVKLKITSGKYKDEEFIIENALSGNPAYDIEVEKGDKVIVGIDETESETLDIYIASYVRDSYLLILVICFIGLLLLLGGFKGLKAVITLTITALTIIQVMLPLILKGYSPILIAVFGAAIITITTFVIVGGLNIKSLSAIIGTIGGVIIAGILAYIVGSAIKLTGLSSEESMMLMYIPQGISFDFRGLLFAGIIIGTLGAVMDVGMSIASAMYEMRILNPEIKPIDLIKSGMNIGKDIMGTMSNTLILAYAGSSLPLLLLFMAYEESFINILNLDLIATEIVRSLVGSIGLILAIPLTALTAGLIMRYKKS